MSSLVSLPPPGAEGTSSATDPPSFAARFAGFALVCLQLALILLAVHRYDIATRHHLFPVLCIIVGGFVIHSGLPPRYRAPFFCVLSLGGLVFVLGWPDAFWVMGIGGGLIAVCHLPIRLALRVTIIGVAAFVLAMLRVDLDRPFWPVLGSMFMFRLIVYLYELGHTPGRPPVALSVAYFFPLQNVCFLFFPILDFRTFRETYRPDATWEAAQAGVGWIAVGLSHLLAYRVIKYYVLPAPHDLTDPAHLALFLAASYALYLHISGYFHIITGVFHLFGFALPRTHHHYFLASSFTDIWRRINIYWKDFMTKVFFLPTFFALRGWGNHVAAGAAVLWVFLVTWALHAYQVFWITGSLPIELRDALLWLAVGVLVAWNLQCDLARARRPDSGRRGTTLWSAAHHALQVVGMFALVSLFWGLWNTPAVFQSLELLPAASFGALSGAAWVAGVVLVAIAVGVVAQAARGPLTRSGLLPLRVSPRASALGLAAILAGFVLVSIPGAGAVVGPRVAGVIAALRSESATALEAARAIQGYYEEIAAIPVRASPWLAAIEGRPTPPGPIVYTDMSRPVDDLLERELIPNWSGEVGGTRLTINRLGMRDRPDRSPTKPAETCRIAVIGSSAVMGYGVADGEVFTRLLEDDLNASRPRGPRFEVLNFGTGMSQVTQRRVLIDRKVWTFEPDVLFYVAHQDEIHFAPRHLAKLIARGHELPYPCLREVAQRAGVTSDTAWGVIDARLRPFAGDIVLGVYRDLVVECRRRGVIPAWVYLPMPGIADAPVKFEPLVKLAAEAGFTVIDLTDWPGEYSPAEVKLGPADYHPNAFGHRIIARRLEAVLRQRPELLPAPARLER